MKLLSRSGIFGKKRLIEEEIYSKINHVKVIFNVIKCWTPVVCRQIISSHEYTYRAGRDLADE